LSLAVSRLSWERVYLTILHPSFTHVYMTLSRALEIFSLSSITNVTADALKKMYHDLAKTAHPDSEKGDDKQFVELKKAYVLLAKELLKNPTAGVDSRDLTALSRQEIMEKYEKDTSELQHQITLFRSSFEQQEQIMDSLKTKVESILAEFEEKKNTLQTELEKEVGKLEKQYSGSVLSKIFFFWPKMSEDEFWNKYNHKVTEFTDRHSKLDVEFFQEMLNMYGNSLNDLSQFTKKAKEDIAQH